MVVRSEFLLSQNVVEIAGAKHIVLPGTLLSCKHSGTCAQICMAVLKH